VLLYLPVNIIVIMTLCFCKLQSVSVCHVTKTPNREYHLWQSRMGLHCCRIYNLMTAEN